MAIANPPAYGWLSGLAGKKLTKVAAPGAAQAQPTAPDMGWLDLLGQDPYSGIIGQLSKIPSLAGMPALARKQALASLAPALAGLGLSSGIEQRQLRQQETRAQEFAKALAAMNMQAGNQVYGNYSDAAKSLGALGSGLTGAVAGDWQNQVSKVQAAVDQMTEGRGGSIQGYDPAAMQNTQQIAGVALPAADLEAQALRAGALTRANQAADVMGIGDIATQYRSKLADVQAQLVADKGKLYAQEPALIQKQLESLKGERTTQMANLAKMLQARSGWQTDLIQLQQKQESADAYNDFLHSKTTLSGQEQAWKKKYEAGKLQVQQANARTSRIAQILAGAKITGVDSKGNILTGFYLNPKTNKVEKQPPNTAIGKDGMPHYLPGYHGGSSSKAPRPPGTSVKDYHQSMLEGLTSQFGIFADSPVAAAQAKYHDRAEIVKYLNDNFGKAFVVQYPNQKKLAQSQIEAVADAAVAWLEAHNKQAPKYWPYDQPPTESGGSGGGSQIGVGPNG